MTRPPVRRLPDRQDTTSLRVEPSRQQGIKTLRCHRRNTRAGREERDQPTPTQTVLPRLVDQARSVMVLNVGMLRTNTGLGASAMLS